MCRKCGVETILSEDTVLPRNAATLEHFFPRGHPRRAGGLITLYCNHCNQKSGEYYQQTGKIYHLSSPGGVKMDVIHQDTLIAKSDPAPGFSEFRQKIILSKVNKKLSLCTAKLIKAWYSSLIT